VDHNTGNLHHFQLRELFSEQPFTSSDIPYTQSTLAHNLLFYRKLMKDIQDAIYSQDSSFLINSYIPFGFHEVLKRELPEVFK
jgi:queuine/archaeosine tRNA-ribosyltransferase